MCKTPQGDNLKLIWNIFHAKYSWYPNSMKHPSFLSHIETKLFHWYPMRHSPCSNYPFIITGQYPFQEKRKRDSGIFFHFSPDVLWVWFYNVLIKFKLSNQQNSNNDSTDKNARCEQQSTPAANHPFNTLYSINNHLIFFNQIFSLNGFNKSSNVIIFPWKVFYLNKYTTLTIFTVIFCIFFKSHLRAGYLSNRIFTNVNFL